MRFAGFGGKLVGGSRNDPGFNVCVELIFEGIIFVDIDNIVPGEFGNEDGEAGNMLLIATNAVGPPVCAVANIAGNCDKLVGPNDMQ